ncbi:MAG: hypothetical protein E7417_01185 [Ruminococcaceae bacterium]|nr:hypothetical protein [Oscillospiraceae bacterium]
MIVITKGKILTFFATVFVIALCVLSLSLVSKEDSLAVFSAYENIINRQLMPQETEKPAKDKLGKRLLKHIFKLDEPPQPTPAPTPSPTPTPSAIPSPEPPLITSEIVKVDRGLDIKNATDYPINLNDYLKSDLDFKGKANILIMHTHTTESFAQMQYAKDAPDRNLDENRNMIAVGKAMAEVFKNNGISVSHDTTVHDYPSYNSAYQRAAATIQNNIKRDGSINIVLDVHRDGITRTDGTKVKLICDVNGEACAQIMLVVGTNSNLKHDGWKKNLAFATQIQNTAANTYPGLMRPIDLRRERFNQQLTSGSLIVEVGANGNTLEEAIAGAKAIANVISQVVK